MVCGQVGPGGWTCQLRRGHDGLHRNYHPVQTVTCSEWEQTAPADNGYTKGLVLGLKTCPKHGVAIAPDSACERCMAEDPRFPIRYEMRDGELWLVSDLIGKMKVG